MLINTKTMKTQLEILPSNFNNIQSGIESQLYKIISSCNEEDGFIKSVSNIKYTNNPIISRVSGSLLVDVKYDIETIKPMVEEIIECKITNILKDGIYCSYDNFSNDQFILFIPITFLTNYEFNGFTFINSDTKKDYTQVNR